MPDVTEAPCDHECHKLRIDCDVPGGCCGNPYVERTDAFGNDIPFTSPPIPRPAETGTTGEPKVKGRDYGDGWFRLPNSRFPIFLP